MSIILIPETTDVALLRWRGRSRAVAPVETTRERRLRARERESTRDVISQLEAWAGRLETAVERAEQIAPLLFRDGETNGGGEHARGN